MKTVILKDGAGNPQGVIRDLPGDQQRLYDRSGNSVATYRGRTNFTYDNNGVRFGSGNRLAGLVDEQDNAFSPGSTDDPRVPLRDEQIRFVPGNVEHLRKNVPAVGPRLAAASQRSPRMPSHPHLRNRGHSPVQVTAKPRKFLKTGL